MIDLILVCPTCEGETFVEEAISGGAWNTQLGGWEPAERRVACGTCQGTGEVSAYAIGVLNEDEALDTQYFVDQYGFEPVVIREVEERGLFYPPAVEVALPF